MQARRSSRIHAVGYSLLLFIVALALAMMPRALALDPGDFGALRMDQRFDRAAGLDPLGASALPELRIWSSSGAMRPEKVLGIVVTPSALIRYELAETSGWGRRYDVTRRVHEATPLAARALRLMHELAASDNRHLVCGFGAAGLSVSGYVDGREFHFAETGDCRAERAPVVDEVLGLVAARG